MKKNHSLSRTYLSKMEKGQIKSDSDLTDSRKPLRMQIGAGFSLVELMVGIAIIITATTVVLSIIVSSFRISNKTTTTDTVRQNGNYAISQISRMIQFAELFDGVSTDGTTFDDLCVNPNTVYSHVRINYQGATRTISCASSSLNIRVDTQPARSIINNSMTVQSCEIRCHRDLDSGPVIGISFDLVKGAGSAEQGARVNFSTQVKMRNNN